MSESRASMSTLDYVCVMAVVLIWGVNFAVMKYALQNVTPMVLGALRYGLASLPLLLFVRMPKVSMRYVIAYGMVQGVAQFGLLFVAISLGMAAGVASLVLQTQAMLTLLLAALFMGERTRRVQWIGAVLATAGLGLIAASHGDGPGEMTLIGFVLTIAAALMWAVANLLVRHLAAEAPGYDAFAFIVWSSLVAFPPFVFLSLALEEVSLQVFARMSWQTWAAVVYLAVASTLVGYTLWTNLLKRHPSSRVAPFSLLVPVVGLATAAVTFGETLTPLQWLGALGVLLGLVINQFGQRLVEGLLSKRRNVSRM